MKTYRVIVTPLALEHLQRIADYIAVSLQAPDTALRWLDKAERAIASLENMPLRFMTVEEEPWRSKGIRRMLEGNYFVYYIRRALRDRFRAGSFFHRVGHTCPCLLFAPNAKNRRT